MRTKRGMKIAWWTGALLALIPALCAAQGGDAGGGGVDRKNWEVNVTVRAILTVTINARDLIPEKDWRGWNMHDSLCIVLTKHDVYRITGATQTQFQIVGGKTVWVGPWQLFIELVSWDSHADVSGGGTAFWKGSPQPPDTWRYVPSKNPYFRADNTPIDLDTLHLTTAGGAIDLHGYCPQLVGGGNYFPSDTYIPLANGKDPGTELERGLCFKFREVGKTLQASGQVTVDHQKLNPYSPQPGIKSSLTVQYNITARPPSPVEAIIQPKGDSSKPKDDYKKWIPTASTKQGKPGGNIAFTVELKDKKTGDKPTDTTATFKFRLLDTSNEPGSCMNSPWKDTEPDMKILASDNANLVDVAPDGQSAKSHEKVTDCPVSISCFDGGAYSHLEVTADLSNGTSVTAYLKEDGSESVRIPYDVDGSHIAYQWELDNEAVGKAPESDDADKPEGNGFKGDGFTLWEKYRGFLENGTHIRLDPRKKNLFICDTLGGWVKWAIVRFAQLTGLAVHDKLTRDELGGTRVMNRNHANGAHEVDQHGLLTWFSKGRGSCQAVGGPGPPRTVSEVRIDEDTPGTHLVTGPAGVTEYPELIPTVVHELLHACNVWHHGEGDRTVYWHTENVGGVTGIFEYSIGADGLPKNGRKVVVMDEETDTRFDPLDGPWVQGIRVKLGVNQGQHSGYEDCVMRYDCSKAYAVGDMRYCIIWYGEEPTGQGLCRDGLGTGVNDPGHRPHCRYGNADPKFGNCTHQICVNDRYVPLFPGEP